MNYFIALGVALILNAAANLLIKLGMKPIDASGGLFRSGTMAAISSILSSPTLLIGLACFGINVAFYMYALQSRTLKISLAYPIMVGGGYVIIAIVARFHPSLAERLTWEQVVGVGMILGGVVLIATHMDAAGA